MKSTRYLKVFIMLAVLLAMPVHFNLHAKEVSIRSGNIEAVQFVEKGKVTAQIFYFYEGEKKVRGEYWEALIGGKKNQPGSNIFAGTAVAAKFDKILAGINTKDNSGIVLDTEKDGFVLKSARTVRYNAKGQPEIVMARGYTSYPVLGVFKLKTDYSFKYDAAGRLMEISESNLNVDSLILNAGVGNFTEFERDARGRPVTVRKILGSIPPATEQTVYTYAGESDNMLKTVYQKCALDTKSMSIIPSETITIEYGNDIPWGGMQKYEFIMDKSIKTISIYNDVEKKQTLEGVNFKKMNMIEKATFAKKMYDLYKNEQKGPKWRMGELPDIPEPFKVYKDYKWWE